MLTRLGYNYTGPLLRKSWGLTSFFMLPEQGMKRYELLSRGSLFFVSSNAKRKKFHLISAAHITHPFDFPYLYPRTRYPWLAFVYESATMNKLQYRQEYTGTVLEEFSIEKKVFKQDKSDLVVMHLKDERHFLHTMEKNYKIMEISTLDLCDDIINDPSQKLEIIGHDFTKNDIGVEVMVPVTIFGHMNMFSYNRYFIKTPEVAVMGLCGGPVLLIKENSLKCMGMVEALVTPSKGINDSNQHLEKIHNNTVVVPSKDIKPYLYDVEKQLDDDGYENLSRSNQQILRNVDTDNL